MRGNIDKRLNVRRSGFMKPRHTQRPFSVGRHVWRLDEVAISRRLGHASRVVTLDVRTTF
jgi:hypothetical protein